MSPPAPLLNEGNAVIPPLLRANKSALTNGNSKVKSAVLHRSLTSDPLKVVSAFGNYLHLSNGQSILDATGGAAVSCLGHGNARVKKAIVGQMDEVSYCHSLFYTTSAAEDLAKELIDSTGGEMARAFIVSSGLLRPCVALKTMMLMVCRFGSHGSGLEDGTSVLPRISAVARETD